jgi:hypothetical protein
MNPAGTEVTTSEISVDQWRDFFGRVDAAAREQMVSVEIVGPEIGSQTLARDVNLRGIAYSGHGGPEIELDVGIRDQTEHRVIRPAHVYAAEGPDGGLKWLDLEDDENVKTLIYFQSPPKVRVH